MDLEKYRNRDYNLLTEKQKVVFFLALNGKTQAEISRELGCSRQNISIILKTACDTLDGNGRKSKRTKKKTEKPEKKERKSRNCKIDYEKYKTYDLGVLTERQKEILRLKQEHMTYSQIAEKMGTSSVTVGTILKNIVDRLEGRKTFAEIWNEKNREKINASRRKGGSYAAKQREIHNRYVENNKEKIRKYNREWYLKNRERILEKQKKNRIK